jgi:hypothetical protein
VRDGGLQETLGGHGGIGERARSYLGFQIFAADYPEAPLNPRTPPARLLRFSFRAEPPLTPPRLDGGIGVKSLARHVVDALTAGWADVAPDGAARRKSGLQRCSVQHHSAGQREPQQKDSVARAANPPPPCGCSTPWSEMTAIHPSRVRQQALWCPYGSPHDLSECGTGLILRPVQ